MTDLGTVRGRRGALVGAAISDLIGAGWAVWAASALPGAASATISVVGLSIGLGLFFCTARLWRLAPRDTGAGSMFSSRAYRVIVGVEATALVGGNALLGSVGGRDYIIAWVASVVGAHFLAFGRLFWHGFYWLGTAMIAAAVAGAAVGLAGGGPGGIKATAGLLAAASLLVAGGRTLVRGGRQAPHAA